MPETRVINRIVLHTCLSDYPSTCNFDNIKRYHTTKINHGVWYNNRWHRGKGYKEVGFHFFITKKGETIQGRRIEIPGGDPVTANDTIEICIGGKDNITSACMNELISVIKNLCVIFKLNPIKCLAGDRIDHILFARIINHWSNNEPS